MKNDMTAGVEWKHIFFFSLPIMIGNLLQQLYNTVDGIVVGNFVSESALAAVGSCMTLALAFLSVAMGLSNGSSIMIAQLFGARRTDELRRAASTALIILCSLGVVFTLSGFFLSRFLIEKLIKIEYPEISELAVIYFRIYCLGLIFQFAYNCIAAILRAVGDSRATLYFLVVSAVMNIILDLLFVIAFNWGVAGAAIATVISQLACVVVSLVYMWNMHPLFRFKINELIFDKEKARINLKLGIPTMLQQLVVSFGHIFIQRLVNGFGQNTMAAFTVGTRMDSYLFITVFGFNMGASTFTGQNMGAGHLSRVKKGWLSTVFMSCGITFVLSVAIFTFARPISALFGVSGRSMEQSIEFVRFICTFFILFAFYGSTSSVLQGSGDVMFSTFSTLATLFVRVTIAYIMVYGFGGDYYWAWRSIPIGWTVAASFCLIRFVRGSWKTKAITRKTHSQEDAAVQ